LLPRPLGYAPAVEITLALCLPRDARSVPVARHVIAQSLRAAGFLAEDVGDVEQALSEACGNVLRHSRVGDSYEVRVRLDEELLRVEVVNVGGPFDGTRLGRGPAPPSAESGRGIHLMRALVDELRFEFHAGDGSFVSMTKRLRYAPDALLDGLAAPAP
jgi:serine/threonine-protein kinase RsbW